MDIQEENEEARAESEPVEPLLSRRPRLPILLLWAFLPAISLTLSGLCMEFKISGLDGVFMVAGLLGGPLVLLAWSVSILWPTELKTVDKVVLAIPMTMGACAINVFLAAGACSLFDPPFLH